MNWIQNSTRHTNVFSFRGSVKCFALTWIYCKRKCTVRKLQTRHPRGLRRALSATALITRSWDRNPRRALVMSVSTFMMSCAVGTLRRDDLSTKQSHADQILLDSSPFHYNYTAPWRHMRKRRVPRNLLISAPDGGQWLKLYILRKKPKI